jgi:hypothetical protein
MARKSKRNRPTPIGDRTEIGQSRVSAVRTWLRPTVGDVPGDSLVIDRVASAAAIRRAGLCLVPFGRPTNAAVSSLCTTPEPGRRIHARAAAGRRGR